MAGLIKQLLLDYAINRLPFEQKTDIATAIHSLQQSRVLSDADLLLLDDYLSGYTVAEIAEQRIDITENIEKNLIRIIHAIEHASGYTDINFIRRIRQEKKYSKTKIPALERYLHKYGQMFISHEPMKEYTNG